MVDGQGHVGRSELPSGAGQGAGSWYAPRGHSPSGMELGEAGRTPCPVALGLKPPYFQTGLGYFEYCKKLYPIEHFPSGSQESSQFNIEMLVIQCQSETLPDNSVK